MGRRAVATVSQPAATKDSPEKGSTPDVEPRPEPTIDPVLIEQRDALAAKEAEVVVLPRPEPTIDPVLLKQREAELKKL